VVQSRKKNIVKEFFFAIIDFDEMKSIPADLKICTVFHPENYFSPSLIIKYFECEIHSS
jgi:hypothetical protein